MPFVPRYHEAAEAEIIDNLMAVTDRDMKAALDYFDMQSHGGVLTDNLPDFGIKTDGEVSAFRYPVLVLAAQRVQSEETTEIDEGNYLDQTLTIAAAMEVLSTQSLKDARSKARKYVRAFKAVVRSASASDLLPETARVFSHTIEIDHRYLRHGTKGTDFIQPVEMAIKIKFGES